MKKRLVLMAMAGVALAGCVNDEVADISQKQEQAKATKIVFESPVMYNNSNESRATVYGEINSDGASNYTYPKEEDFQIYAIQHTGDFTGWVQGTQAGFNNTSIEYDDQLDGWVPMNDEGGYYYWPDAATTKMSFAACSPADLAVPGVTRTYGATGLTIENFEVSGDASKQYDLMYSERALNMASANMNHSAGKYSGIPIQFQHALSSIRFSLLNKSSEELILKRITVYGTKYKGKFQENIDESINTGYVTEGTGKNVNPSWDPMNDLVLETNPYVAFQGAVVFPTGNAQYVSELAASDTDAAGENEECNMLLLLPQDLTADIKIHVEYTVNGHQATKTVGVLNAENTLNNSTIMEWKIGTRYTYRLYYSSESADKDKIYFAPSSDTWQDAGAYVIELL